MSLRALQEALADALVSSELGARDRRTVCTMPGAALDACRDMIAYERLELGLRAFPSFARLLEPRLDIVAADFRAASAPFRAAHRLSAEAERLRCFLAKYVTDLPFASDLLEYEAALFALRLSEGARLAALAPRANRRVAVTASSRLALRRSVRLLLVHWNVTEIADALVAGEPVAARRGELPLLLQREMRDMGVLVSEADLITYRVAEAAQRRLRAGDAATAVADASATAISFEQLLQHVELLRSAGVISVS